MSVHNSECSSVAAVARYDNYQLWRVQIDTEDQLTMMKELERRGMGIEFIGHVLKTGQNLRIIIPSRAVPDMLDLFTRYNLTNIVLLPNLQENIDVQRKDVMPKDTKGSDLNWTHYCQLETIMDYLQHVSDKYDFVTLLTIGQSFEGRPIKGIKISKPSASNAAKTSVFIEGGIHAREWISPSTVTYLINQLLTSKMAEVQALTNDFDWFFFPVVNPDGYVYTFDVDRLWRKNRKPYGISVGVDLNRNFDCSWGTEGYSTDPNQFDFAGSGPNSEPEVKALSDFLTANRQSSRIETFISLHSSSQLIMFPYGHTEERVDNYDDLQAIGEKGREAIKATHGRDYRAGCRREMIYPSSGSSSDWVRQALDIKISFTFELRGPPEANTLWILPANEIIPVGEEVMAAFVAMLQEGKGRGYYRE